MEKVYVLSQEWTDTDEDGDEIEACRVLGIFETHQEAHNVLKQISDEQRRQALDPKTGGFKAEDVDSFLDLSKNGLFVNPELNGDEFSISFNIREWKVGDLTNDALKEWLRKEGNDSPIPPAPKGAGILG